MLQIFSKTVPAQLESRFHPLATNFIFFHTLIASSPLPIPSKNIFPCRTSSVGNDILGFDSSGSVVNQPDHGSLDWVKVRPNHQHKLFWIYEENVFFKYFVNVDINYNFSTLWLLLYRYRVL